MPRAASVWVDVLPSMAEFRRDLRRQLEEPVRQSATRAGEQGGDGLMSGMAGKMKAGALAAGAAAGVLVAKGVALSMEKAAASGKLQASLGLSDRDAARAGAAAGRLYANGVTESITEGADSVKAIMSAGLAPTGATTKQLATIATKTQDLSTLFEVDLGQAANAAGQAVKTGLAKNASEALDTMTRGFQVMGPRADDLADTFNEYSTIFRSLNLPIKTVTGLLAQGMKAGARDTDVVADALKEFQIRATDGSTSSAAGFKALGLSAKDTTAQIARGGKGASDGLQTVLDRLRAMKDPVKRNAAAVALFGTKAEDMGKALYALDPSKAEKDLGRVGGAAKKAGNDLRKNAGMQFEIFKRKALMAIGDAAARYALPALLRFGRFLNSDVLPPVKTTAAWLGDHLMPVLNGTGSAISGTVRWFKEWGIWLTPLAILIGGITLALSAQAIVTGTVIGVMTAYSLASRGIALVTQIWTGAQAALNAVMALNPFVLVAIAVVALGAALYIAWKRSETFRDIVTGVWSAIQTGAMWLWTNGIKPMVDGFMSGVRDIGTVASWLWSNVLSPTFSGIATGAKILATILAIVVFGPIYLGVKVLGAVFGWLWSNAIQPAFGFIAAGAKLWWTGVQLYFSAVMTGLRAVGSVFSWLWTHAAKPVLGWIVAGAKLWWVGVQLYFSAVMTGLRAVGSVFTWLWRKGVSPALSGIKSVISSVYNTGIKPVFDALRGAVGKVGSAFDSGQKAIGKAWSKVEGITKKPIAFVIDTVYNDGIVGVWNKVAGTFGAPTLHEYHPKGFAKGGVKAGSGFVLPGMSSYKNGDDQLVPMRRGEGVAVSEAMRDPYERARLLAVNKAAMTGKSLAPFQGQGFAKGGLFGWVGSAASKGIDLAKSGVSWLKDGVKASAVAGLNKVVEPLIDRIAGSSSVYRDMVSGIPKKMIKEIVGYSGEADKKLEAAGIGGKGFKGALSWARSQNGKAYQWGGNGDPSWDCSGFMSAIESVIRGQKPHRRWATGSFSGATAPAGWVKGKRSPFMIGVTNAGVGHTAGTLNGVNVESRGGDGVVVGARARGYRDALFRDWYGFSAKGYADGGKPRPGELAWVGERGPELVKFKGGEEVYNHRQSLAMAEGWGARGFAKGTSAKARKDLPGDLTNFTKSLTGSAADISKAAKELAKDLKATGGSGKALAASVTKVSAKLQAMAKQRDAVDSKLAAAKAAAADQKKTASDYLGLSNFGDATSVADILGGLGARQATLKNNEAQIASLAKRGLSQDYISQLVAMGPDSQLTGLIAGSSAGQIKQLNAMAKSGAKLSTLYGRTMADSMYDAGDSAAKGFLAGLLAQEKEIQRAMAGLGAGAVKAIRSKKGIDAHSPSRKGAQAGEDLGAGLIAGMAAVGPSVQSAAAQMGDAAIPAGVVPVTSGASAATASSGLDGRPLYLVVDDTTTLRVWVDDRVDEGLGDVRRSKRSGKKGR
ncbi:phage tail tape measure protein [Streptomyces sp. NPDC005227]|uniref:phage tail tape measure protein n=1 Tax=Streptomyces sp. NPDC005227 TaxID=3364707 RepID=UPI00367D548E